MKFNRGNPRSQIVFSHLAWYTVDSILKDNCIFDTGPEDPLPQINAEFKEEIKYAFGLIHSVNRDKVEKYPTNILYVGTTFKNVLLS